MTHFVYITEECLKEVEKASLTEKIKSFKCRIEQQHSPLSLFHPFPPPFIVKKKWGNYQGRLIASEDTVEVEGNEYNVIIFLAFMTRGNKDYDNFQKNPSEEGNQYLNRINKQKITEYVADQLKKDPPKELEPLSQAQQNYLYGGGINHFYDEIMICESVEWVDAIKHEDYASELGAIRNTLFDNFKQERGKGWREIESSLKTWKILLSYFPQQKKYFLVGIDRENKGKFDELRKKYADLLSEDDNHVNTKPEILTQKIRRMYPEMALLEGEGNFWIEIQKNPQGNIALSEEEVEILNDINDRPFPLFINGRAGSGKSTVLQYLFTDYLCRYLSSEGIEAPPVYFTCNAALLDTAKKLVHSLFKCNMGVVEKKGQASKKSTDELLKDSFHEFHSYLSSLLPDRENLFPKKLSELSAEKRKTAESQTYGGVQGKKIIETVGEDCFVRFSMFKKLWYLFHGKDNKAKKEYGPDVCWHVIRSYIKGMSVDGYLEKEDYAILDQGNVDPQNESKHFRKTVTDETFAAVYDKVWSAWYEPLTDSESIYWDDQDLVRHLLGGEESEGYLKPTFAGIFCDESQDFTRIELEAVLRLSLFSNRKVNPREIPYLPFVFAGDEFQTLNPTGFRWDSIKAWFTEKFIFALDPKNVMKHKVNFRTLHNNYRSSAPIVGFSNRVQFLRAARFGITNLEPQQSWNKEEDVPVVFFNKNENNFWKRKPEGTVFLVPCEDEASVAQYVRDNFKGRISLDDENNIPSETVLSAIEAKGSEYDCVALYGFAASCPKELLSPFTKNEPIRQNQSKEADIPLEYFLNNVYVAVTRAKKRLIILDDFDKNKDDPNYFWNAFPGEKSIDESISNQLKGAARWTEELGVMVSGNETSLNDKYDQVAAADEHAKKGRSKDYPNPGMLRQAAIIYKRIGDRREAMRCTAEANQMDKKYAAAAKDFKTIGEDDHAIECYWVLANKDAWKEIAGFEERVSRIEVRFSAALSERQLSNERMLMVLREMVSEISENNEKILDNPAPWCTALEALLILYAKNVKNTEQGKAALRDIKKECDKIRSKGLVFSIVSLGKAAAEIQYHEFVIQLYEQEKGSEGIAKELSLAYKKAKVETTSYPEILDYLDKTEDKERIVELFKQNTQVQLNQQQTSTLVDVILTAGKWNLLKFLLPLLRSVELYGKILSKLPNELEELKKKCRLLQTVATLEHNPSSRQWENTLLNSNDPAVVLFITRALARSKYTEMSKDITLFLRTTFAPSKIQEVPKNYWLEVGTAIERAGRRIDALAYYEATREKSRENKSLWKELTTRLIVCKERQGKAEVGEQKPNEANRKFAEAQNLRQEIEIKNITIRDYLKIEWEDLYKDIAATSFVNIPASAEKAPTVPEKPTFSESEEANSKPLKTESIQNVPVQTIFAGFKIEQLDNNRIRLENIVTRDRVTIKNGKIDSPDYEISSTTGKSFLVEGANLTIDIEENGAVKIRDTSTSGPASFFSCLLRDLV